MTKHRHLGAASQVGFQEKFGTMKREAPEDPSSVLEGSNAFGASIHPENVPGPYQCQDAIRQGAQRSIVIQRPRLGAC